MTFRLIKTTFHGIALDMKGKKYYNFRVLKEWIVYCENCIILCRFYVYDNRRI